MKLRTAACWIGACVALASAVGPAMAAEKTSPQRSILGVWMGIGNSPDSPFKNTPWSPAPEFTEAGKQESAKWNTAATPGECNPFNPVWFMNGSALFPIEISETNNLLVMHYEATNTPRRIYMDGRGHPPDWDPTWLGHSIGRWEGDTLVIDTVGTNGRAKPINGFVAGAVNSAANDHETPRLPASDQLHSSERIRVVGDGQYLEDEITVSDPKTYKQTFKGKHYWQRRPDIDVQEYFCTDNRRQDAEGQHDADDHPLGGAGK